MRLVCVILLFGLTACGDFGAKPIETPQAQVLNTNRLSVRDITLWPGQCALIFRLRSDNNSDTNPPIFAQSGDHATMILNTRRVNLRRTDLSEASIGRAPKRQTFISATNINAKLILRENEQNQTLPLQGVLSLTKSNGWSTVIPLIGGRVCKG